MFQTLKIKNLAIVENVEVGFERGLNIVTGETGAGKSVIVGALGLVLGERADKSMIRSGEDKCSVEACFQLSDSSSADEMLEELGIDTCEDGNLIIRRIISSSGSGKNIVNDCPTTIQVLKKIGDLLVDMHGPHDHQSLLNKDFQLDILDSFGHLWKIRSKYEEVYNELKEIESRREELECDDDTVAAQIDILSFQIKEIEEAELKDDDSEAELEQEHKMVANAARILELSDGICNGLAEDDMSAFNSLISVQSSFSELAGIIEEADEWKKEAESIVVQIQELSKTVNNYARNIEGDHDRLQWLEDRKALFHKLKRKYGSSVSEILETRKKAKAKLNDLETREQRIAELDKEIKAVKEDVHAKGAELRVERIATAESLSTAITKQLHELGFEHGSFDASLEECEPKLSGMDDIVFGFAPNVGETMRSLSAIASSGEISRVMLAIKTILADHDRIPVLVFDEIDTNIGGEIGNAVGAKLKSIANTHQLLCITHLPQVAVCGKTHFFVSKEVIDGRTCTNIERLDEQGRTEEVARMLGGRDMTSVTLKHAQEMLELE